MKLELLNRIFSDRNIRLGWQQIVEEQKANNQEWSE
jgi:hypothetical protein